MDNKMDIALIWDVDGTLIDSYGIFVDCLQETLARSGVILSREEIHRYVITNSIGDFIPMVEKKYGISFQTDFYTALRQQRERKTRAIPHATDLLLRLTSAGVRNFIFTHRDASTKAMLSIAGLENFFEDAVTSRDGFPRKPAPDGLLHLMQKHGLAKERTFYVGDRPLDMECAVNAGVSGIFYLPKGSPARSAGLERFAVHDLLEIYDLIFQE